jgi:hypothetical protein
MPEEDPEEKPQELDALHVALAERIDALSGELVVVKEAAARAVRELEEEIRTLTECQASEGEARDGKAAMERFAEAYREIEEE